MDLGNDRITRLHDRIEQLMMHIRSSARRTTEDPRKAKGSEVWRAHIDGEEVNRAIIYLRSSGCGWAIERTPHQHPQLRPGCIDCQHSVIGTTYGIPISGNDYLTQFESEFQKRDLSHCSVLCIYNEGSFFNDEELPHDARSKILETVASNHQIRLLVIESLPEYLNDQNLKEVKAILGNTRLEIGIGLESSDPLVRSLCVNKSHPLERFEAAVSLVKKHCRALAYVMIKPSFLTEKESLDDAIESARYAFRIGVDVVSLEPVSIGDHNMCGTLNRINEFKCAWLWTVRKVARTVAPLGETRIGGYQFAPKYNWHSHNCGKCTQRVLEAIDKFNATYDLKSLNVEPCECQKSWLSELRRKYPPLLDRIESQVADLETQLYIRDPMSQPGGIGRVSL